MTVRTIRCGNCDTELGEVDTTDGPVPIPMVMPSCPRCPETDD